MSAHPTSIEGGQAATLLAEAASHVTAETISPAVRDQARDLFLDTLAVSAAGLADPEYSRLVEVLATETGPASVPGRPDGVPVMTAVQINGGATTVLQLQDGHRLGRGHPVSHMMPALLALAEQHDLKSRSLWPALIAGYEVGARVGVAMGGLNHTLHDTGTWSTIAAAVAAAHALTEGDAETMRRAIETAAATALMPYRDLPLMGASAHHTYIGLGAVTGLTTAQSAVAGLSDLAGTLEDFFGPRAGADFKASKLTDGLTADGHFENFEIMNAYIKVHPTCAHLHGANDALKQILSERAFGSEDVVSITIATYGAGLAFDNPTPDNALAARFSHAAAAAVAVCFGELTEATLTDAALADEGVRALMRKVSIEHDPALDTQYPSGRPTTVRVELTSGDVFEETVVLPKGDSTNTLSRSERTEKVIRLLSRRFSPSTSEAIRSTFRAFCDGHPVAGLTQALRSPHTVT